MAVTGALAGFYFVNGHALPLLLAVGLVLAVALGYLAMTRIALFALTLLAIRSSLDITNMQESSSGVSGLAATAVSLLLIFTVVTWIAAQHQAGNRVLSPLSLAGVALASACVISVVGSLNPVETLTEAGRVTSAVAMLVILTALLSGAADVRRLLRVTYLSMTVPLAFAVVQAVTSGGHTDVSGLSRIVGTFIHPNAFGAYLAVLLVAGVALLRATSGREHLVLVLLLLVGFGALLLTLSRGSWLATVIGLVAVAFVQRRPTVLLLMAGALGAGAMVPAVWTRLADLGEARSLAGTEGNSLVWRIDYWRQLLQLADQNPATGVGLNMAQFLTVEGTLPHNDFIRMYVEVGWIGLLSLIGLLVMLAVTAYRAARQARTEAELAVAAGFSGALAAVTVVMVGGNVISAVVLLWYFFALAASAHAVAEGRFSPESSRRTLMLH
jgi:O-antigen ligase